MRKKMDLSIGFFLMRILRFFLTFSYYFGPINFMCSFFLLDLIPHITIYRGFLDHCVCDVPLTLIQCLLSLPFNILVIISHFEILRLASLESLHNFFSEMSPCPEKIFIKTEYYSSYQAILLR